MSFDYGRGTIGAEHAVVPFDPNSTAGNLANVAREAVQRRRAWHRQREQRIGASSSVAASQGRVVLADHRSGRWRLMVRTW